MNQRTEDVLVGGHGLGKGLEMQGPAKLGLGSGRGWGLQLGQDLDGGCDGEGSGEGVVEVQRHSVGGVGQREGEQDGVSVLGNREKGEEQRGKEGSSRWCDAREVA